MKKGCLLIIIVFLLVFFSQSAFALREYNKSLAYDWLYDVMDGTGWNKKVDQISLSLLALSAEEYDISAGVEKLYEEQSRDFSWNKNLENTAWATFALDNLGYSVINETDWLLNRETSANLGGEWLIQILTNGEGECTISYDDSYATFVIDGTEITSGCDVNDPWINVQDCVTHSAISNYEIFDIYCSHSSYDPSLLFYNDGEYYLLGSGDLLELENGCYSRHGVCSCSDTGYVTWVLKELSEGTHVENYLEIECTSGDMENAFLYLITGDSLYAEKLIESQRYGRWIDTYTTAFVVMALKQGSGNSDAVGNATDWLERHQDPDGSWDQDIKDTSMVLYALYGSGPGSGPGPTSYCGDGHCDPGESITCPDDCDDPTGTCNDDDVVDEAAGEECDAQYYSDGTLQSGNDSACASDEWCVDCDCQLIDPGTGGGCDVSLGDECEINSDCETGEICNTGCECELSVECELDDDCWYDELCINGSCVVQGGDECELSSECEIDEDCIDGFCVSSGVDSEDCSNGIDDDGDGYIDCEDTDCDGRSVCESGGGSRVWWIAIIVIVVGLGAGYFVYTKYFKDKKQDNKRPSFDKFLQDRSLSKKPVQIKSVKKRGPAPQYPVRRTGRASSSTRDVRLEKQLDESLKKARDLLKKK